MKFEWDEAKAKGNFAKHGISFDEAAGVFHDPFGVELVDNRANYGEERTILIGMSGQRILVVVYTERVQRTRIISARRATKHERDYYYRENAS